MKWVYIRWEDSQAQNGWQGLDGEFDTWVEKLNMVVESIGFLVAESKDAYVISGHLDSQSSKDHFDGVHSPMKIPKRAVLEIHEIDSIYKHRPPLDTPEALAFVKKSAERRTGYVVDNKSGGPYNALFHPESPDEHSGTDQKQEPDVSPLE